MLTTDICAMIVEEGDCSNLPEAHLVLEVVNEDQDVHQDDQEFVVENILFQRAHCFRVGFVLSFIAITVILIILSR